MDREEIYLRLPVFLQNIALSVEGFRINQTRYGTGFHEALRAAEDRLSWDNDQILRLRDERLRSFLKHCADTVPYYKRLFAEYKVPIHSVTTLEDMKMIPLLTKAIVQEYGQHFLSDAIPYNQLIIGHTSGTTGGGLRFATTLQSTQEQWAIWWRYRRLHGIELGTMCGYFGGRSVVPVRQTKPPFWRYNNAARQILFSAYHMSPLTLTAYVDELNRRQPSWLHGYPSLISLIAAHMIEHELNLDYVPKWITTGAENLMPQQINLIVQAFGVRPIQHYGAAEAAANFFECKNGKLHINEDFAAVEFIPNEMGEGFRIVGTNFTNLATPLLRYDIGDLADFEDGTCDCGLPGRIINQVDGRKEDYILLSNGVRLGRMDHIFKDMTSVKEAQLYQDRPGSITVRIVKNVSYTDNDERCLISEFRKRVGNKADFKVEYLDQITRSSTGKLRFVVSDIKPDN